MKTLGNTCDRLASGLHSLTSQAEDLLKATAQASEEGIVAARDRLAEQVEHLRSEVTRAQRAAMQRARVAAVATDRYVHDEPWKVIAGALIAGALLGYLGASTRRTHAP